MSENVTRTCVTLHHIDGYCAIVIVYDVISDRLMLHVEVEVV